MKSCIIKIENGEGVRYQTVELGAEPITIGRNWHADIVLDDRFVDEDHLQISLHENGSIMIRDLGTVNGTLLKRRRLDSSPTKYNWTEPLRLGDSKVCLIDADAKLEPTSLRSSWVGFLSKFNSPAMWFLSVLLLTLVQLGGKYLNSAQAFDIYKALYEVLPSIAGVISITLFFGLISRVLKGESNFGPLWILSCWIILLTSVSDFLIKILRFNWQNYEVGQLVAEMNGTLILAVFMFALLSLISNLRFRSRLGFTVATASIIVFGLFATESFQEEQNKWTSVTTSEQSTLPSAFLLRDESSYQDYNTEVDRLFEKADAEVERLAAIDDS